MFADTKRLRDIIAESGITMTALARRTGIERATLYNRLKGIGDFTASEIVSLQTVLGMTNKQRDEIFLTKRVN